jgi:hypothetical protein
MEIIWQIKSAVDRAEERGWGGCLRYLPSKAHEWVEKVSRRARNVPQLIETSAKAAMNWLNHSCDVLIAAGQLRGLPELGILDWGSFIVIWEQTFVSTLGRNIGLGWGEMMRHQYDAGSDGESSCAANVCVVLPCAERRR